MAILDEIKSRLQPLRNAVDTRLFQGAADEPEFEPLHTKIERRRTPRTLGPTAAYRTEGTLQIPCPDPTAEDEVRDQHHNTAQKLVRQENWTAVSRIIAEADQSHAMTPGAMPVAELMAYGARADVVLAVEHALLHGQPEDDAPLLSGIEALESVLLDHPQDAIIASIVAQAHMDLGWAWRGTGWDTEIADINREAFSAHFERARDILAPFLQNSEKSALLATTLCSLLSGTVADTRLVADRYQDLIDLNPLNPRPMRAMGTHLLPRWRGSYEDLELEARRTASRTQAVLGAAAYTWVMLDAVACDETACANLDVPFFVEGLRDILTKHPDPYTANLLAAYCANATGHNFSGDDIAEQVCDQIGKCTEWIVREHLTELHPMIWAHAARGFDNNARVHSPLRFAAAGREDAMRVIKDLFRREISAGKNITFTEEGPIADAS